MIINASFTDYLIPTSLDMPPLDVELVEDPEPDAPYGVKGVGEPPTVVSTAAVAAALRAATGRELARVPVTPAELAGCTAMTSPRATKSARPPARRRPRGRARRPRRHAAARCCPSSPASGSTPTSRSSTASSPGSARTRARETIDASGRYVVPGFVDAHVHLESSKLLPDEFARLMLPLGTTAVVADPHELANVLGTDGVHWLLDACARAAARRLLHGFFVRAGLALRVAAARRLSPGDLEGLLRRRRVIGVAEMMNFPGVIAGDPGELAKLGLQRRRCTWTDTRRASSATR